MQDAPIHHETELRHLLAVDPRLEAVAALAGPLPERPGKPGFEGLASVVTAQLVSRQSADAIWARLTAATGPLTPESYMAVAGGEGPRLGLTAAKADTLLHIAGMIREGRLDLEGLSGLPADVAVTRLTALKGIGLWTAEVHLLFNCGHPDIFPSGDLALRIAVGRAFGQSDKPESAELRAISAGWSPWRSTAARLFWAYYGRVLRPGPPILP